MEPLSSKGYEKPFSTNTSTRIEQASNEINKMKNTRTPVGELSLSDEQYQKLYNDLKKEFEEQKRAEKKLRKKKKK